MYTQLQAEVGEWSCKNFPNNEPFDPFYGMIEEIGELAHAILKKKQGIRGTPEEHDAAIKDAIADCMIFATDYCCRNYFDLSKLVEMANQDINKHRTQHQVFNELIFQLGVFSSWLGSTNAVQIRKCFSYVIADLQELARIFQFDFDKNLQDTWNKVKERDWQKDKLLGGMTNG